MSDEAIHNRALYLAWLRQYAPELYADVMPASSGMSGILDSIGSAFNSVVSNVSSALPNLATTYAQYRTQRDLIETNNERARRGEPPLVMQDGQLMVMGGEPYTDREWNIAGTGLSPTMMILGAVAFAALLYLLFRRR